MKEEAKVTASSSSSATVAMHFHRPGMPQFSAVAGASGDTSAIFDPRLLNGDSWLSDECHCLNCEGLRVTLMLRDLKAPQPPVIVLLDLDNFGYMQFQLCPPRLPKNLSCSNADIISNMFVWGFFGSCFTRYHRVWPSLDAITRMEDGETEGKDSVWRMLVREKRVMLTPCSGKDQGADGVIETVVDAFSDYKRVVVTGDVKLIEMMKEKARKHRKRLADDSPIKSSLSFVNASALNKKLVGVWHSIAMRVNERS